MLRDKIMTAMTRLSLHSMKSVYDEVLAAGLKQRATPEKLLWRLNLVSGPPGASATALA